MFLFKIIQKYIKQYNDERGGCFFFGGGGGKGVGCCWAEMWMEGAGSAKTPRTVFFI